MYVLGLDRSVINRQDHTPSKISHVTFTICNTNNQWSLPLSSHDGSLLAGLWQTTKSSQVLSKLGTALCLENAVPQYSVDVASELVTSNTSCYSHTQTAQD